MSKFDVLDLILQKNSGYLKTSDAIQAGVSKTYLGEYVQKRDLVRVIHGLYKSKESWDDEMYVIMTRYPLAVFSHETAVFLLNLADREPTQYSLTLRAGANTYGLTKQGVKVYKIKEELFNIGITETNSPAGHTLRVYNPERTICDLVRSRNNVEIQDYQTAIQNYVRSKEKNLPLLMRYAKLFSVDRIIRQYMEVLLF